MWRRVGSSRRGPSRKQDLGPRYRWTCSLHMTVCVTPPKVSTGHVSWETGRNLTIAGPAAPCRATKRMRVTIVNMSMIRERQALVMVGMPSIVPGHTNQFIDDGSFWSPDVSERSASCGA